MADSGEVYDFIGRVVDRNTQQIESLSEFSVSTTKNLSAIANKIDEVNKISNSADIPTELKISLKVAIVDIIEACKNIMEQENSYKQNIQQINRESIDDVVDFLAKASADIEGTSDEQPDE